MADTNTNKTALTKVRLIAAFLSCALLLAACGPVPCDFCGKNRFCKTFDIVGVERHICNDCLNDPRVAISGNLVREYSEMYENGALEYPEDSPLNPNYGKPTVTPSVSPTVLPSYSDISVILPEGSGSNLTPVSSADPTPAPAASVPSSGNLSGEALVSALNQSLAADSMSLTPISGKSGEYTLMCGGSDTGIRFKTSAGNSGKDKLVIEQGENASSSDYVKSAIRSILTYMNSTDYDGLGHDIYNGAIQSGSFIYNGTTFVSTVHTADEIEKGAAISDFSIVP